MIRIQFGKKKTRTLTEFSKKVIAALVAVWFVGALVGASSASGKPTGDAKAE